MGRTSWVMDYLISHCTLSISKSSCHSVKIKINLPHPDQYKILIILRRLQHTQLNTHKNQPHDTNCTGLLKVLGHLKNRNGWQFVGDESSWQFIVTSCLNIPNVSLNWFSGCCTHWDRNCTWISHTFPMNEPIQQHTEVRCNSGLRWTSVSSKLSAISILQLSVFLSQAKSSLCIVAAFCVHSVESFDVACGWEMCYNYLAGKVNLIFLTEWQEESYKCLRCSDVSNNPSLKLFIPYYLN